jgi:O-antigen ligase
MRVTAEGLVVAAAAIGYLVLFNASKVEYVAAAALALASFGLSRPAHSQSRIRRARRGLLALAAGVVGILVFWRVFPLQAGARFELWYGGIAAWLDKPALGWGLGSFEWGYGYHRHDFGEVFGGTILSTPNVLAGSAHNVLVQTLAELGLFGLACASAVVFMVLRYAKDQNAKAALVIALGCMMVSFPEQNPFTAALIAVAAGIATSMTDSVTDV